MSQVTMFEVIPDRVEPAPPARPRLLLIGTALVSMSVAVGFASLIGIYVATRAAVISTGGTWLPRGVVIPLTQPNMMMFTLVFSAATMVWATQAMRNDDRANFYIATSFSMLLAIAYIAQTAFLLTLMDMGVADDPRAPLFYALIGTHLVLTIAAIGYLAGMVIRTVGGEYSAKDLEGIYGASMFWYTIVGLYLVMWYVIYITK